MKLPTSLALFNASAKAELGSTEAPEGGGTLLKAIASAMLAREGEFREGEGRVAESMMGLRLGLCQSLPIH